MTCHRQQQQYLPQPCQLRRQEPRLSGRSLSIPGGFAIQRLSSFANLLPTIIGSRLDPGPKMDKLLSLSSEHTSPSTEDG